jgi:quercetin dioxygenase-like cupin family protein
MVIRFKFRGALWGIAVAAQIMLLVAWSTQLIAQEKPKFQGDVLTQFDIGSIDAGRYELRTTLFSMEPGATAPHHIHKGPGVRYVLEGAVTVYWKDKGANTFGAGSTYTEGPGEKHTPGVIAARNLTSVTTKVLIVELLPLPPGPTTGDPDHGH